MRYFQIRRKGSRMTWSIDTPCGGANADTFCTGSEDYDHSKNGAWLYHAGIVETNILIASRNWKIRLQHFTGGRAAEEVVFGEITTGASNDIEQATKIASSYDRLWYE